MVAGIENAVSAAVILARPDTLFLAPEFMLLGERWFPDWRTDHRTAFQFLCAAFATSPLTIRSTCRQAPDSSIGQSA